MSETSMEGRGSDPISDYLAVMAGTAPVSTVPATGPDEVARVHDGIQALTKADQESRATKKLHRSAIRTRVLRGLAWLVVIVAAIWIGGNVYGYATATQHERPVVMGGTALAPASVRLPGDVVEGADCFGANAGAEVWKAAGPAGIVIPYRCGDGIAAAIVPGPVSVGAWVLGFVSAILLVELHRRRKVAWY